MDNHVYGQWIVTTRHTLGLCQTIASDLPYIQGYKADLNWDFKGVHYIRVLSSEKPQYNDYVSCRCPSFHKLDSLCHITQRFNSTVNY